MCCTEALLGGLSPQADISAQVFLAVAVALIAAGYPISQAMSRLDGLLNRVLLVGGVAIGILATVACVYAVVLSSEDPPAPIPPEPNTWRHLALGY
jgi:hypothetical protein